MFGSWSSNPLFDIYLSTFFAYISKHAHHFGLEDIILIILIFIPNPNQASLVTLPTSLQLGSLALSAAASVGIRDALEVAKAEVHRWTG